MLEGERRRRLSGVCFRSDLFHKWFSLVRRVGSADTFSFASDRAEMKQRVTYGIKNKINALHVKSVLLNCIRSNGRSFFFWCFNVNVIHLTCAHADISDVLFVFFSFVNVAAHR